MVGVVVSEAVEELNQRRSPEYRGILSGGGRGGTGGIVDKEEDDVGGVKVMKKKMEMVV